MKYCSSSLLLFIVVSLVSGQHTTSPRFSPVPQPTSSGISCIQMVCPSDSLTPKCPSDCPSGCKYIPDQCCPQTTIAVCQEGTITASSSLSSPSSSATSTASLPTITTAIPPSSSVSSNSSSPTASPKPSLGINVQPSFYSLSSLVIMIGCLLLGFF